MGERLQEEAFKKQEITLEKHHLQATISQQRTRNAEVWLVMKTKCKPVPSQAMQLQIHPGLVSKVEEMKSLVWVVPFLWGRVPHCASLYTYTKLLHETCAPQAFSCHSNTIQVTKITSVPTQLDPCREKTSFAFSFLH